MAEAVIVEKGAPVCAGCGAAVAAPSKMATSGFRAACCSRPLWMPSAGDCRRRLKGKRSFDTRQD